MPDRICPLPFDKERNKYYRIRACFEPFPLGFTGTMFSRGFVTIVKTKCDSVTTNTIHQCFDAYMTRRRYEN